MWDKTLKSGENKQTSVFRVFILIEIVQYVLQRFLLPVNLCNCVSWLRYGVIFFSDKRDCQNFAMWYVITGTFSVVKHNHNSLRQNDLFLAKKKKENKAELFLFGFFF